MKRSRVGCLVVAVILMTLGIRCVYRCVRRMRYFVECPIPLPTDKVAITFLRRATHPFLADYVRCLRFELPDGTRATKWLPRNPGGATGINVYWYDRCEGEGPFVRFRDYWYEYIADLDRTRILLVHRLGEDMYVCEDTTGSYGYKFGYVGEGTERRDVYFTIGENAGWKATGALAEDKERYIGRLEPAGDGVRFVPVSESPEETFETVEEWRERRDLEREPASRPMFPG